MGLTVAIIEPDTNVASHVEQTFTKLGFATHVLADGDVVEFVRTRAPTVILLNVELSRGSGYSLCNRLKKQQDLKRIPIILTSGKETAEAFAEHQRSQTPADAYLHKPFSMDQLVDVVGKVLPEAFPNGAPDMAAASLGAAPNAGATVTPEVAPALATEAAAPSSSAPPPRAPGLRRDKASGPGVGPSLDELIAQGRSEPAPQPPGNAAGHEAKTAFLRESLRQKEQDLARARELWSTREREMSQLTEVLELRERELERARKAREDLLAQLTASEDKIAVLRLDIELGGERTERLDREKKALGEELENVSNDFERTSTQQQGRLAQLERALQLEQTARADENDHSASDIKELVHDLERARAEIALREGEHSDAEARARALTMDLQGKLAGLQAELANVKGKLIDSTKDGDALKRELTRLRSESASDTERARSKIDELEGQIRDLSLDKDGTDAELSRTVVDLAERDERIADAFARITDLDAELADTQGRLSDSSSRLEESETRAQELHNDHAEMQQHALELSQSVHRLELKHSEAQRELSHNAERLVTVGAELEQTKQRAATHARDLDARLQMARENVAELEDRLRENEGQNTLIEGQLKEALLRLEEKHKDWDLERINRQKDVQKRDQRIGDLEQKTRELDDAVHDSERFAKQREAELGHELDVERARADELDRDAHRARTKATELDALLEDIKTRLAETSKELKRTEAKNATLNDETTVAGARADEVARLLEEQKERTAFAEAELAEERANHAQDVQAHVGNLDRTSLQAKERVEKLQDQVQRLKADLGAAQADAGTHKERLVRTEEKSSKIEALLEREQRDRQQIFDRNSVLDEEVEGAQARAEALADENTRIKAALKRAQDEGLLAKRERSQIEERFKVEEFTMVKRVEDAKQSAVEAQGKIRTDLERVSKERDDARTQALDIRRKAEALMGKYRALEASVADRGGAAELRVTRLADELRSEKEMRATEKVNANAIEEKLEAQISSMMLDANENSDAELANLRAQLKDRDDRLQKAGGEYNAMRERARDAIGKLKALAERAATGGDSELKTRVEQLTGKYNEVVGKLKTQAELNKKIDGAYKELAEKHRRALVMLKDLREQSADESTQIVRPPEEL